MITKNKTDAKTKTKVFTYGTLMTGFHNNAVLGDAPKIGNGTTKEKFTLYHLPYGFPGAIDDGLRPVNVRGEVYEVDSNGLARLDRLEGYRPDGDFNLYDRKEITVALDSGEEVKALIYIFARRDDSIEAARPTNGDWRAFVNEN